MRKAIPYIAGFLLFLMLVMIIQSNGEKPTNWEFSLSPSDKIPYGTYLTHELLKKTFPGQEVEDINEATYMLANSPDSDNYKNSNIIIFCNYFEADQYDVQELLRLAEGGNSIFIAANSFQSAIADTLKLALNENFTMGQDSVERKLSFVNHNTFPARNCVLKNNYADNYFSGFDTANTKILGNLNDTGVNFIRVKYGQGEILLSSCPVAFTNYYIVDPKTRQYPFYCLSYLPQRKIYWNEYYNYHSKNGYNEDSSLTFIFKNPPLRWALMILIFGLLLYILFEGKRKQRIIAIMDPYKNTTLEFADTMGRLYYERFDHKNLAEKKINYFFDYLRTKLYLRTDTIDAEFYKRFRDKTGMSEKETAELFVGISRVQALPSITEKDLLELNKAMDEFYNKVLIR